MKGGQDLPARQQGLNNLLNQKKCFKLICGAGNENLDEIEKLIALYAKAGCHFFDLSANEEVLKAAQRGLDFSIPKKEQIDYYFCISIGTNGDQHMQKASINPKKCVACGKCINVCPQGAIEANSKQQIANSSLGFPAQQPQIIEKNCIGCLKCQQICENNAIEMYQKNKPFSLSSVLSFNLSCIELHASDSGEKEVDEIWEYLNKNFDGMLSLCIGRGKLSDDMILSRVERLMAKRKPYTTIIQADGNPMSGGKDDYETTLPAVETGKLIQSANLPVYLLLSGGTNTKTAKLARNHDVNTNGIAMGSYARKIVKQYLEKEDFYTNINLFDKAFHIAEKLVKSVELK